MDSEDDHMNNAEDDYIDSDGDNSGFIDSDGDSEFIDMEDDNDDDVTSNQQHQRENYTILNEQDICQRQQEDITRISNELTISKASASILLRHFDWITSKLYDAWFANEEKVRSEVGLLERPVFEIRNNVKEMNCGICFESFTIEKMNAAACGHLFCSSCWTDYISISITDGPGCLMLRCPEPSCRAAVDHDMVNLLVSEEHKDKYSHYLVRSYVESNRKTKWCPAPGCNYAVDFDVGSGSFDVSCKCSYGFCWNCTEEAHRPVDCGTVANWILKNSAESENMDWILANSKPCPKCSRPIEKNQGCMHMVCSPPCKFHFCWLCLGDWADHGEKTGGFYACNAYEKGKSEGKYAEAVNRREMAKRSLQRYTHYYERWTTNHSSWKKAVADLEQMSSKYIDKLQEKQCQSASQVKFVTEAWIQIIECRRVLKWTYAYGFYIPEYEHTKKQLFEYLQGEAESGLERLHQCAEKELLGYISKGPSKDFNEFQTKLAGLTGVTRNYFENLVRALENGLSDVKSQPESSKNLGGTQTIDEEENLHWFCKHCTFANEVAITTNNCQICNLPRNN